METGSQKKVAVVTGGRSGIGHGIAVRLAEDGFTVYVPGRKSFESGDLIHIPTDVTNEEQVKTAVQTVIDREGRIDLLVNCAGDSTISATEFTSHDEAVKQMSVLFDGMDNMTRAVLPRMRMQKSGRILNVSSMAAFAHLPFQNYYSAGKAAVNAYTDGLRAEVKPFGIECAAVLPGDVKTGLTAARRRITDGDAEYSGRITRAIVKQDCFETEGADPMLIGKRIAKIAQKRKMNGIYTVDALSGFEYILIKFLPRMAVDYVVGKLYGEWDIKERTADREKRI